ncbi:MAG: serine hydrolase domain-containing protein [Chitinophagaceae bacterium]
MCHARNIFSIFFSCLLFLSAQAQFKKPDGKTISSHSIDSIVADLMDKGEVTGLCLGIINNNKPAYVKGYGYKNKPLGQTMDTATSLYAASLAKSLFAYLVMQLVDKKMLDLDKPLYTYLPKPLPEYENYKDLTGDERWKLITARHCLSHTTGFPNWRSYNHQKLAIFFTPGKFFSYSGEGIELLQLVVEQITGHSLEYLAAENIFKPFGMHNTSFVWQHNFEKNMAVGHDRNEDSLPTLKRFEPHAAGSMQTTIADYTRFLAAVLQSKRLSAKTKQAMLAQQIAIKYHAWVFPPVEKDSITAYQQIQLGYGLGWGLFNTAYGQAFFKEGHLDGWVHYSISFPGTEMSYTIMTNSSNGESIFKELVEKLTGVTIPWQWEGYTPYRATAKLTIAQLKAFTGEYDGKLKAIITLEGEKLKVESPSVGLPKTTIYPASDHHLFLKIMDANFQFVKGPDGRFNKILADDEGEQYELTRIK